MDTKSAATMVGTTPKRLRQFLRSPRSTYQAVGSTSRYEFSENEIEELKRRFDKWNGAKAQPVPAAERKVSKAKARTETDQAVWDEEASHGRTIVLEDLRIPTVRARVRAIAAAQEARLNALLLARGVHVSQGFVSSLMGA